MSSEQVQKDFFARYKCPYYNLGCKATFYHHKPRNEHIEDHPHDHLGTVDLYNEFCGFKKYLFCFIIFRTH